MSKTILLAFITALFTMPSLAFADRTSDEMVSLIKSIIPYACEKKKAQAEKFKAMDDLQRASQTGRGGYEQLTTIQGRLAEAQRKENQADLAAKPYSEKMTSLTSGRRATPEQAAAIRPWLDRLQSNPCAH